MKHSESSRILTVFTEAQGKISLMAKGIRKGKGRSPADPFSYMNLVYSYKSSRDIQVLTQIELVDAFMGIRENMDKMRSAFAVCELTLRTIETQDSHPALFAILVETLQALNKTTGSPHNYFWRYGLRLIQEIGFGLDFNSCQSCGKEFTMEGGSFRFSFANGGLICGNCQDKSESLVSLRGESVRLLQYLNSGGIERAGRLKPSSPAVKEIDGLLLGFLNYHVEGMKGLKTAELFKY
ncbi:DNA repair protein RecO [bacterium]|nr:DNA repair protein RecO [bacterium]